MHCLSLSLSLSLLSLSLMEFVRKKGSVTLMRWSDLPEELLELILNNLLAFSYYIQFRSVCKEWRSLAKPAGLPSQSQLPLLMLPYHLLAERRSFFLPSTGSSFTVSLPELVSKAVVASYYGWMVLLDMTTSAMSLFNPVTRAQINLPPTDAFHKLMNLQLASDGKGFLVGGRDDVRLGTMEFETICKWLVSLSSSPADEDCVVVVSDGNDVYFCKPGDLSWSSLAHHYAGAALYDSGRFYVVGPGTELSVFDAATLTKLKTISSPIRSDTVYRYYISLAKSSGELFLFAGNPNIIHESNPVEIFKIRKNDNGSSDQAAKEYQSEWSRIKDLRGTAVFWSMKQLMVVAGAGGFPECDEGSVYFNAAPFKDEVNEHRHRISRYAIRGGDFELLSCGGEKPSEKLMKPVWVTLSLR